MWDKRYQTETYVYGKKANDFLVEVTDDLPKGALLSLGEGEGRNAVYMAKNDFEVTAVDLSPVGLEKALSLAKENGVSVKTEVADLNEITIEESSWDVIISIFCHLPADVRKKLYCKIVRGLKPGGWFVLEAYSPEQLDFGTGGPGKIDMLVDLPEISSAFGHFHQQIIRKTERNIVEGHLHNGQAAVVQFLGQKLPT